MTGTKLLVDLSAAGEGYTGIGHDNRLIFSMLSGRSEIDVSGLVYPIGRPVIPTLKPDAIDNDARIAAIIHGAAMSWGEQPSSGFIDDIAKFLGQVKGALRTSHRIDRIPEWMKTEALWRILFQRSLLPGERKKILSHPYYVSDIGYFQMHDRNAYFSWMRHKWLDTGGFDAVLFPYPRPVRLRAGVKRIVRYHDAIPITHPDTVVHWIDIVRHYRYTTMVARDGVFVCNSPMSVDDLDHVAPGAAGRAVMIPCAIHAPAIVKRKADVRDILARRTSLMTLGPSEGGSQGGIARRAIEQVLTSAAPIRYMISVSALEPRKNFVNSIAAWERLRLRTRHDIKFVIVSSSGWQQGPIHKAMRPHVQAGNLMHLEDVTLPELQALYERAEFCVFPSYAEGFGYAPLEALQMGTPSLVSDLPVFRWTLGDAAIYADPYDVDDLSDAMQLLLDTPANRPRRAMLEQHFKSTLDRFSISTVSDQWRNFFAEQMDGLFSKSVK